MPHPTVSAAPGLDQDSHRDSAPEPWPDPERDMSRLADEAVRDLVHELAQRSAASGPGGIPPGPLTRLHVLAHLMRAVDRRAQEEATSAARQGARYPQIGEAWGITRQGARKRWPGLVFTAQPPSRPLMSRSDPMNGLSLPRSYSVLLVEDDPADVMLIQDALGEGSMTRSLTHVGDGVEALEYLRDPDRERPDLIVLDLNMPRMNGREFLAVLQDDPDLGSIPLVVLTTSAAPDDIADAYRKHANAYVTKPVNLDEFLEAVQRIDRFFLDTSAPLPRDGH
jgi:CheY-like chemotaxis protein